MTRGRARVLTLLATAGRLGLALSEGAAQSTPTDSLRIPAMTLIGPGALIGALMNVAAADKHVVYAATTSTVRVAPTLTPTRAGGTLTVRW